MIGLKLFDLNIDDQKNLLFRFNILPFKMRIFNRLNIFCYKILNQQILINNFFQKLKFKNASFFRNRELLEVPDIRSNLGRTTFNYFLPKFVNTILKNSFNLNMKDFSQYFFTNLSINYKIFANNFNF